MKCIVELDENVFLADWEGDPGRTVKKENAKIFKNSLLAWKAGNDSFVNYKRFKNFRIIFI